MREYIEECLTPLYRVHWLTTLDIDQTILFNIRMYVAMNDNRLLRV